MKLETFLEETARLDAETNKDELDKILRAIWIKPITGKLGPHERHIKAKAAIEAIIQAARIEELQRLHRFEGEGLPNRDYDNVTDELIDERIKELE